MLDLILLGVLAISVLVSLFRGLVREVLSLATWIVAVLAAWMFNAQAGAALAGIVGVGLHAQLIAGVLIFFGVMLIGRLVGWAIASMVAGIGLGFVDRLLGTLFGALRGVLAVFVVLTVLEPIGQGTLWWNDSRLVELHRDIRNEFAERTGSIAGPGN